MGVAGCLENEDEVDQPEGSNETESNETEPANETGQEEEEPIEEYEREVNNYQWLWESLVHPGDYTKNRIHDPSMPDHLKGRKFSFTDVERQLQSVDKEIRDKFAEYEDDRLSTGGRAYPWEVFNLEYGDIIRYVEDPLGTAIVEFDSPDHELLKRMDNNSDFEYKGESNLKWEVYEGEHDMYEGDPEVEKHNAKMLTAIRGSEAIHVFSPNNEALSKIRKTNEDDNMENALSLAMSTKNRDRKSYPQQDDVMKYIISTVRKPHRSGFLRKEKEDTVVDDPDWETHGKELEGHAGHMYTLNYKDDNKEWYSWAILENNGEIDHEYVTKSEKSIEEMMRNTPWPH